MSQRVAFVFPGQGSQQTDMASAWLPGAADLFSRMSAAAGIDLVATADDAGACAGSTALGQPAILSTSLAALAALADAGITPDVVAGHSLGELSAAVAAGVLTPEQGASVAAERGRAMGAACATTPGTMAAVVRVDVADVEAIVADVDDVVVANVNSPQQAVLAGDANAIAAVAEVLKERRGRVLPLPVEGAFHSPAMAPAVVALTAALDRVDTAEPGVPLVSGLDGRERTSAADVVRALVDGVLSPVRWVDVQSTLVEQGVDLVVEVGPGKVLAGLAKRSMGGVPVVNVQGPDDVAAVLEALGDAAEAAA